MKFYPEVKEGTTRIKKGFLFFPKRISGITRWLEFAIWEEKYIIGLYNNIWINERWIDL